MFCPDVENLYKELESKAEENKEVDEDNLINCVVYEGGLDYCSYDKECNKVGYIDDGFNEYDNEISERDLSKIKECTSVYPDDIYKMCGSIRHEDIPWGAFYTVPDAGRAMITSDYISNKDRKYGCVIVAATGILNWQGRNHGRPIDTYDIIWNYLESNNMIEYSIDNNGQENHGVLFEDMKKCFNEFYFPGIANINTTAEYDYDVRFEELKNHVGGIVSGEKSPCILAIHINDKNYHHAVNALSVMEESDNNDYIGIWNGWRYDDNIKCDPEGLMINTDTLKNAYKALRYISWNDLKASNIYLEALYFKNVKSLNIKEPYASHISGNEIELSCFVPNGTKVVYFPTWTTANGQDDVVWHHGTIDAWNHAICKIDINKHNKESGEYITHIYAYDGNNNLLAFYGSVKNSIDTLIRNPKSSNIKINSFSVSCNLPTGTAYVSFPTWTAANGQDDLVWHEGTISNGTGKVTIDVSDHNNEGGTYCTHIYAYDDKKRLIHSYGTVTVAIAYIPKITDKEITRLADRYTVTCKIPTGTSSVKFPTWTAANGQDDLVWYSGTINGNKASITVYRKNHNKEGGPYYTDIYAYDLKGRVVDSSRVTVSFFK